MIFNAVKALRTAGGCMLFLGLTVAVLAAQNTAPTRTTLSIAANDAGPRTRVTLTAHVSATSGAEAPSGVINFRSGNLDLGSAVVDRDGNASLETDVLPQGDHRLVAIYKGAEDYQASVSRKSRCTPTPLRLPVLLFRPRPRSLHYGRRLRQQRGHRDPGERI